MDYKEKRSTAIREVFKLLYGMSQEELDKEIKKYSYEDRTKSLLYAWDPDYIDTVECKVHKIIEHYQKINNSEQFFTEGGCYLFYRVLKSYFKEAEAYYDQDHVITKIDNKFYDITGEIDGSNHLPLILEPNSVRFFEPLED